MGPNRRLHLEVKAALHTHRRHSERSEKSLFASGRHGFSRGENAATTRALVPAVPCTMNDNAKDDNATKIGSTI